MPDPQQQKAFGEALRGLMQARKVSQRQLGEAVADGTRGSDKPYAQSTVRDWIEKSAPEPEIVFYIEGYLLEPPGSLSQHLGYLPTNARSVTSVEEALMMDATMGGGARDLLVLLYGVLADKPLVNATLDQFTVSAIEKVVESAKANAEMLDANRMKWDDQGRLIDGFDVAPPRVVMVAMDQWGKEESIPMPKALLAAARAHREHAQRSGFAEMVAEWDAVLGAHIRQEQFASAALGGEPESIGDLSDTIPVGETPIEPEGP